MKTNGSYTVTSARDGEVLTFVKLKDEQKRTYIFPAGERLTVNVTHISVAKSGTHRLDLANGKKVVVSKHWLAIEFEAQEWTF